MKTRMKSGFFLDSNILIYEVDRTQIPKLDVARSIMRTLAESGNGALSTQVLAEFYWNSTRKIAAPLSEEEAGAATTRHSRVWTVVDVTPQVVLEAVRLARLHRIAYWDAQLIAAAASHGVPFLLSEDLGHGALLGGVRILNPFRSDFKLSDWI